MENNPTVPNPSSVRDACERFDKENAVVERALAELFRQYPTNDDEAHVLLKVVARNRLYFANILAVGEVARLIYEHKQEVDGLLNADPPSPEAVDKIVELTVLATRRRFWSFATKYCSWHRPESYPIWDTRVAQYLRSLKGSCFSRPDNWTKYREFVDFINRFRDFYKLSSFTFKEIDKFLWLSGEELMNKGSRF